MTENQRRNDQKLAVLAVEEDASKSVGVSVGAADAILLPFCTIPLCPDWALWQLVAVEIKRDLRNDAMRSFILVSRVMRHRG